MLMNNNGWVAIFSLVDGRGLHVVSEGNQLKP